MSQLKAFIEKAQSDKELMAKLDALGEKDAGADEIIALAKENGFTVTADELEKIKDGGEESGELAEEDLEAVAGGWSQNRYDSTCKNMTRTKYNCVGFVGLCYCDHYRQEDIGQKRHPNNAIYRIYRHICKKEAFPIYVGWNDGQPLS